MVKHCHVLTHYFLVDDTLFFIKGREDNCGVLKAILDDYCLSSLIALNFQKGFVTILIVLFLGFSGGKRRMKGGIIG